jgi:lysyl-tRNA synthetase, class II
MLTTSVATGDDRTARAVADPGPSTGDDVAATTGSATAATSRAATAMEVRVRTTQNCTVWGHRVCTNPANDRGVRHRFGYRRCTVSAETPDPQAAEHTPDTAGAPTGSGLAAEKARRLARIEELRANGVSPYPYRFDRTHTVAEVRERWGDLEPGVETDDAVTVAGRVMLKRDSGKLVFATIRDRSGDLQLFVSKAVVGDEAFTQIKQLDLGDWVGVAGTVMTTRKGELSVRTERVELLAKAVRPLPDKWHGLSDVDTRFRQRYADLIVNAEAQRAFEIRHEIISSFRRTLHDRGFIEVETPVLHAEAGGAHARPFTTHHNTLDLQLYLRIALELHLKRLIVGGMERVYEIGRIFRNEGISTRHNPEFTMMELYQAFGDWNDVMDISEVLITQAARDAIGTTVIEIRGETVDLAEPWPRVRMVDAVSQAAGRAVHPSQPIDELRALADEHGVRWEPRWGGGKLVEELFESLCEADIVRPTFVTGHPTEISPLARVDRDDPWLTERFEIFVDSRELGNGYSELNDPVEQRLRFEAEQVAKDAGDAERGGVDEDYIRALEYGMPPTGGLGIGMDRVAMLLAGVDSIKDVILFPTLRPEQM